LSWNKNKQKNPKYTPKKEEKKRGGGGCIGHCPGPEIPNGYHHQ